MSYATPLEARIAKKVTKAIVDYNLISVHAVLTHAARYRDEWVHNFAEIQERSVRRATPYAFVIPPASHQRDPITTIEMLQVLRTGDVEIEQATAGTMTTPRTMANCALRPSLQGRAHPWASGALPAKPRCPWPHAARTPVGGRVLRAWEIVTLSIAASNGFRMMKVGSVLSPVSNRSG